jgi:hypothetical protein
MTSSTREKDIVMRMPLCKRLGRIARHLSIAPSKASTVSIAMLEFGDDPTSWSQSGFNISPEGVTAVGNTVFKISGTASSHKGLTSWTLSGLPKGFDQELLEGVATFRAEEGINTGDRPSRHGNTAIAIAELVFYAQDVKRLVSNFLAAGIPTYKHAPLKEISEGKFLQAMFYLGDQRILVTGPSDIDMPASQTPDMWMFGKSGAAIELVGILPVVADIDKLKRLLGDRVGDVKQAAQRGRRICSLTPERSGMTSTFAFLEHAEGKIFGT